MRHTVLLVLTHTASLGQKNISLLLRMESQVFQSNYKVLWRWMTDQSRVIAF